MTAADLIPYAVTALGAGGVGGIIIAVVNRKPGLITAKSKADAATVKEWRDLYNDTKAELSRLQSESEKIRASYYGLLGTFVEFRNHVRTELSGVIVNLDRKEIESARAQLETLGRHVAGVRLPTERTP